MYSSKFMKISNSPLHISNKLIYEHIDFYDVMDFAILMEEEAYNELMELSYKVSNKDTKNALQRLALEELNHKEILENVLDHGPDNFKIGEIKHLNNSSDNIFKEMLSKNASVKDVLKYIIDKEKDSYLFYKDMARSYKDKETKDIFIKLSRLELSHQIRLEKILKKYFSNK